MVEERPSATELNKCRYYNQFALSTALETYTDSTRPPFFMGSFEASAPLALRLFWRDAARELVLLADAEGARSTEAPDGRADRGGGTARDTTPCPVLLPREDCGESLAPESSLDMRISRAGDLRDEAMMEGLGLGRRPFRTAPASWSGSSLRRRSGRELLNFRASFCPAAYFSVSFSRFEAAAAFSMSLAIAAASASAAFLSAAASPRSMGAVGSFLKRARTRLTK